MSAYFQIMKGTWAEYMTYRINFVMWRVRTVMQLLITYFLWLAISETNETFFGYTQSKILTYVLLTSLARTLVLGTTTMEIGNLIHHGNLSNFLVRPINFFAYYASRDIADKALNFLFAIGELCFLYFLLRPQLYVETNSLYILFTIASLLVGMVLYFYFSLTLGFLGFWTPDVWGPRFISLVILEFFAGSLFPLDILPPWIFTITQILPFSYFIYFPIKVLMGQLPINSVLYGLTIGLCWVGIFIVVATYVWRRGLRSYEATGK